MIGGSLRIGSGGNGRGCSGRGSGRHFGLRHRGRADRGRGGRWLGLLRQRHEIAVYRLVRIDAAHLRTGGHGAERKQPPREHGNETARNPAGGFVHDRDVPSTVRTLTESIFPRAAMNRR